MLIKYVMSEQIILDAEEYTVSPTKSIRQAILAKYLFKIIRIPGINNSKSAEAICLKIQTIEILDNIILRKSADMKVRVVISIVVLRLLPQEYYEGKVVSCSGKGIVASFLGGLLEGTFNIKHLHKDTIYDEQNNTWILATGQGNQGYEWKIGALVRFRIAYTLWDQVYEGPEEHRPLMSDLVQLKADEAGLGPVEWWI